MDNAALLLSVRHARNTLSILQKRGDRAARFAAHRRGFCLVFLTLWEILVVFVKPNWIPFLSRARNSDMHFSDVSL